MNYLYLTKKFHAKALLADHGLFVVPAGAVESWILGLTKGPEWDNNWLEKLEPPTEQDFDNNNWWGFNKWAFINKIATWINDPNRKGLN